MNFQKVTINLLSPVAGMLEIFMRIQIYFRMKLIRRKRSFAQEVLLFPLRTGHAVYEWVRWPFLRRQILKEEWLPIVDKSGAVHGKIALNIGLTENKYLHPVVRIAVIHKGMLFLKPKPKNQSFDYPFEWYLRFEESLNDGVKAAFTRNGGSENLPSRFVFRYIHKETNRLIYLYICTLTDENLLTTLLPEDGKWWTNKQIDENLGKGLFSPYFEDEYAVLNTTLLAADRLMNNL